MEDKVVRSIKSSIVTIVDSGPPLRSEYSIYRVPKRLRNVNVEAYTPMVVSIGPYHHGKEEYQTMEYHKLRYSNLLLRDQSLLLQCVKALLELESVARKFYAEAIQFQPEDFVKMMIVDGFFIVELIRRQRHQSDPIFANHWLFNAVHRDMLLLENQLPFSVLDKLYTLINDSANNTVRTEHSFLGLANGFLGHYQPICQCLGNSVGHHHLLHLSQQGLIPPIHLSQEGLISPMATYTRNNKDLANIIIPSATELRKAGIKFRKVSSEAGIKFQKVQLTTSNVSKHLLEVKFIKGVLHIPPLVVDDRTESLFRNLVALEQQSHNSSFINYPPENSAYPCALGIENRRYGGSTPVTDYVTLMDCLINTSADVALLRDRGIIQNWLGDNEEVAQLFNKLRSGIIPCSTEFFFYELSAAVNKFYNTRWHTWKAKLKRDYFNTPWASLSFIAAVFVLICTLLQTVFTIVKN